MEQYENNKTMKILLIFRFFYYIWFIDSEYLFHSYVEKKCDKVLTFNIAHFPIFEISTSLLLAPPLINAAHKNFKI